MKLKFILSYLMLVASCAPLLAEECRYQQEYINADLACNGDGDCMFRRFQASTSYRGTFSDYMDCWAWSVERMFGL